MFMNGICGEYSGDASEVKDSIGFDMLVAIVSNIISKREDKPAWACSIIACSFVAKLKASCDKLGMSISEQVEVAQNILM